VKTKFEVVVNKFGKLAENSGAGVTMFNQFVSELKKLSLNKYGDRVNSLAQPMRLDGKDVKYNISFFNAIDNYNNEKPDSNQGKLFDKSTEETPSTEEELTPILENLKNRFNIPYEFINDKSEDFKGNFDGKKVRISDHHNNGNHDFNIDIKMFTSAEYCLKYFVDNYTQPR